VLPTQCVLCVIRFGREMRWGRPTKVELDWTNEIVLVDKEVDRGPVGVCVIFKNGTAPATPVGVGPFRGRFGYGSMLNGGAVHVCLVHGG
jgi:hypothetical protein